MSFPGQPSAAEAVRSPRRLSPIPESSDPYRNWKEEMGSWGESGAGALSNHGSASSTNRVFPEEDERFVHTVAGNPKRPPPEEKRVGAGSMSNNNTASRRFVTQAGPNGGPVRYFDFNFHAVKKSVSSGLLDVALLLANSSQLKYVVMAGKEGNPFYEALIVLLSLSICLQVLIGGVLIWLSRININEADEARHKQAEVLNNMVVVGIFILTVLNVFASAIGISDNNPDD